MSNAPIDLSKCFAVQWREFIVITVSDGSILLYNVKWNMWSQLPKLPDGNKPCQGCPLVYFNEKLLVLSQRGEMHEFFAEKNQWRVNQTLTSEHFKSRVKTAVLVGSEGMLFLICKYSSSSRLQVFDGSSWSDPVSLQLDILDSRLEQPHFSVTVREMAIYVSNEHTIYRIQIPSNEVANQPALNGESRAVAQDETTSVNLVDASRKRKNEESDHHLNLGTVVKIPKLDTECVREAIDLENVVTTKINSPPPMKSSLCAVGGRLFAFGGRDEDKQPFSSVYRYVEEPNTWEEAGYMTTARYGTAVAIFERKDEDLMDLFVIGGYLSENSKMKMGCCIADKCEVSVNRK